MENLIKGLPDLASLGKLLLPGDFAKALNNFRWQTLRIRPGCRHVEYTIFLCELHYQQRWSPLSEIDR